MIAGRAGPATALVPLAGAAAAALGPDLVLQRTARRRVGRIVEELPTVLEFLALCLSAGEGILDSLRRVSAVGAGELAGEIRRMLLRVDTGSSLGQALARMAHELDVPTLTRAVDHLVAAIERGAPLAHVLQAQAIDAREEAKHSLMEQAGRKEILMLLPRNIAKRYLREGNGQGWLQAS